MLSDFDWLKFFKHSVPEIFQAFGPFAAITGSNFRIESYPLLASSQHVGATAVVTILLFSFCSF